MCVNPRQISKRNLDGSSKTYIVPCGKCEECKSKKHSDFAALAVLEAKRADSMHFLTFTYRNDMLPIMKCIRETGYGIQQKASDNQFVQLSSRYHKLCIEASSTDMEEFRPVKSYTHTRCLAGEFDDTFIDVVYTPSLRREDMRLFIKRCREDWYREHGSRINCRYSVFGEYGSATYRPHYHAIFFNLTDSQAHFLRDKWRVQFGYADCYNIPVLNPDGSPGRLKVANYVSKYIAKGDEYSAVALNLVERPRRLSSKGFGVRQLTDKEVQFFKKFYQCSDLNHLKKTKEFFAEYLRRNKSFKIYGMEYSMPRKIIELIHYDKFDPKHDWCFFVFRQYFKRVGIKGVQTPESCKLVSALRPYSRSKSVLRPNLLRRVALEFKRSADIKAFNSQFPERSERNSDEIDYLAVRQVLGLEESTSKNRQELAKTINLNSKKKEKYA